MVSSTTKTVEVTISGEEMLRFLVDGFRNQLDTDWDKNTAFWAALGHLVGISDKEAVKKGNKFIKGKGHKEITVTEFRRWLPEVISRFAAEVIDKDEKGGDANE